MMINGNMRITHDGDPWRCEDGHVIVETGTPNPCYDAKLSIDDLEGMALELIQHLEAELEAAKNRIRGL